MTSMWSPTSIEIKRLSQPNLFTVWLYNKTLEREQREQKEQFFLEKKELENKLQQQKIIEKLASMKAILINQSIKSKTEIRLNNDGSICKFLY